MHACLHALHGAPRPTREALLPVSMRMVATALAKVTLDWAHTDWNLRGLADTPFGQWAFACLSPSAWDCQLAVELDRSPPRVDASQCSVDGLDFLSAASTRACDGGPGLSEAQVEVLAFLSCTAQAHASASSRSTRSDGGYAVIGADNEDLVCPLCGLCDDDLRDTAQGLTIGSRELVVYEGCQGGFHVDCMRAVPSLRRPPLPAGHPAALDWLMVNMGRGSGTWRCGACVQEGGWDVSQLIESAVTFGDACCAKGSATYSVLVCFHHHGMGPRRSRTTCMVGLCPAALVPVRSRIPRCPRTCALISSAACAGGRTSMASSAACCSALRSPGRRGSIRT